MEELDSGRYSVMPSSSLLAVEILNGSFAWDSAATDKTSYVDRLREAACRRKTAAGKRSKVKRDGDDDDDDVRPDPVGLLYEAMFARDDSPDVLFAINFAVAKVTTRSAADDDTDDNDDNDDKLEAGHSIARFPLPELTARVNGPS